MQVYALKLSQVMTLGIILIVLPFCSLDKSSVTRIGVSSSARRLSASGALVKSDSIYQRSLTRPHSSFSSHVIRDCRVTKLVFNIGLFIYYELLCVPFYLTYLSPKFVL